jgi:hypothetical protein
MPDLCGLFFGDSMDRQIVYPGQILPETSLLQMTKDSMIGAAKLASALLGTSTMATGFAVTPTGPASLQVLCAPGEIYSLTAIDALAFSTLPADTTHSILKQGIMLDGVTLSCAAPGTTGQSINYLVQVTYQDSDSTPVLLPYYNSANPSMPYSGMGNNGQTQNTARKGIAVVAVKAGASAATGTQVTPSPDAGYIGLYVVTVAFGQTTITSGNITTATNAPLINSTLHGLTPVFSVNPSVPVATVAAHAVTFGQISGLVGSVRNLRCSVAATSASATFTADEIIVESALGGLRYCLSSFNKTINLGGAGAGGIDTGTATANGFVGIYAIYNPTTQVSALLATMEASAVLPSVYGGANMPAGYTASALISVAPISATAGQFAQFFQLDRSVDYSGAGILTGSTFVGGPTARPSTAFPYSAKFVSGFNQVGNSAVSAVSQIITSTIVGTLGGQFNTCNLTAGSSQAVPFRVAISTPQNVYQTTTSTAGTASFTINAKNYEF